LAVFPTTSLDYLKTSLTVTADYSNNTSKTLSTADYSLSGTLAVGPSTVTVTYQGKTANFTVYVNDPNLLNLSGDIIITVNGSSVTTATTGTPLTVIYNGSESVIFTYLWYSNGIAINKDGWAMNSASSATYTPYAPGNFTVMMSTEGYNSKISSPVMVIGNEIPWGSWSVADRWVKWIDATSTATLDYSVDSNGVCAITIGGVDDPTHWNAKAEYGYTANVNTPYEYVFQVWNQSGERRLVVQYYGDNDEEIYLYDIFHITEEPETYTIKGHRTPKGGSQTLQFQGADQTGTFYVKILSITEYTPEFEFQLFDDDTYWIISAIGMGGVVEIPETYNSKPVTGIYHGAFQGCTGITSINIPASVEWIVGWVFNGCTSLTNIWGTMWRNGCNAIINYTGIE